MSNCFLVIVEHALTTNEPTRRKEKEISVHLFLSTTSSQPVHSNQQPLLLSGLAISTMVEYKTLKINQIKQNSSVFYVYINNPSHRNALSTEFFEEFPKALKSLDQNPNVSVIILAGAGNHFCSGIDVKLLTQVDLSSDNGRNNERLRRHIKHLQSAVTALEECRKPVIASLHGACIGGGIDIITACDIRYCTNDAFFSVKEVDLAITADLGTLQRLPAIVGYGNAVELALTARKFSGLEAKEMGLVSRVFGSKNDLDVFVAQIAEGEFVFRLLCLI